MALVSVYAQCNKSANPGAGAPPPQFSANGNIAVWVTKSDSSVLLKKVNTIRFSPGMATSAAIQVDSAQSFQSIDGFGYTLTGGSATLINQLSSPVKAALLQELFGNYENSISISYLRVSVGASDLDPAAFSYNDLPAGETDVQQDKFSIDPDKKT